MSKLGPAPEAINLTPGVVRAVDVVQARKAAIGDRGPGHRPFGGISGRTAAAASTRPGAIALRSAFMTADQEVTARYRKVAEDIKAAIAAGGYAAGTRLPSEHELGERYSVSRGTIRQAFAALRADGVIASRRGARRVVVGGPTEGGATAGLDRGHGSSVRSSRASVLARPSWLDRLR